MIIRHLDPWGTARPVISVYSETVRFQVFSWWGLRL